MKTTVLVLLLLGSLVLAEETVTKARIGEAAPNFALVDSEGKTISLTDYSEKIIVLEWVNFGCPFVRKFYDSGTMQTLQKKAVKKDVVWLTINSSATGKQGYYSPEELPAQLEKEKGNYTAYLLDSDGQVGRLYGAKTTPHIYVIDQNSILVYAGAIDDQPSTKKETLENATNYVTHALDALLKGTEIETPSTQPYGCSVKY
ncbi:thioredoxin family protein [candidate division KSB1 bacterium]|nr:thioredoxin family protein [candidate division KSB1 bacterium]